MGKGGWRKERKMKTWQCAQPVVSGSSRKLHGEKSCLLRLMGRRIWETHFPADPHPAQITTFFTPVPVEEYLIVCLCVNAKCLLKPGGRNVVGQVTGPNFYGVRVTLACWLEHGCVDQGADESCQRNGWVRAVEEQVERCHASLASMHSLSLWEHLRREENLQCCFFVACIYSKCGELCACFYLVGCIQEESTGGGRGVVQVEVEISPMTASASFRAACLWSTSTRCCCCSGDSSISAEHSPRA